MAAVTRYWFFFLCKVDNRFLIHHRAKKGVSAMEQIDASASNLLQYIEEAIIAQGFRANQIIILGAPLKCPHDEVTPMTSQLLLERDTHLSTMRFNAELRNRAERSGFYFANPSDDFFDYASGTVQQYFWSTPLDFHCSSARTYFFWNRAIKESTGLQWCDGT